MGFKIFLFELKGTLKLTLFNLTALVSKRRGMVSKIRDRCVKQRCLMCLTVKKNEFVVEIAGGVSQTSAYRSACNNQKFVP